MAEEMSNRKNFSRVKLLVNLLVLQVVLTLFVVEAADNVLNPDSKQPCSRSEMDATHEVRFGQDVVWQIPPDPKAVLFMAHGGDKDPLRYFDPGPNCGQCSGEPETRTVVLEALRRGYAVIALKSVGIAFVSWPLEASKDVPIAINVISDWTREHSLENLPLSAWGHSAGCLFVSSLTLVLPIRALVLMCCAGQNEVVDNAYPGGHFPPTFFASMPADKGTTIESSARADFVMAMLRERGLEVAGKKCLAKPLSPLFFTERTRCMNDRMSERIYEAYKAEGWLDSHDYLIKNPLAEDWEYVLWKWKALPFCKELGHLCLVNDVGQELSAASAVHTMTSDANEEIYSWLDSTLLSLHQPLTLSSASQ